MDGHERCRLPLSGPLRLLFAGRRARVPVAQQGITPLEVIKLITQQDLRSGPRVLLESEMQQQYLFCLGPVYAVMRSPN